MPVTQPTGCTFVGPALDVLVVTTAVEGLSDVDRVVQADAGRLFTVHVPDVVGPGQFRYRGPLRRPDRSVTGRPAGRPRAPPSPSRLRQRA